ncbi:hypothetical protein LCGC14_1610430 [marine sediment metagenome]|uniref:MOMP-like family protein n=1 Tax=marine sediment metagenome TaxID=412755 RepID=A0A0F9KP60_9ZZZZ
MKNKFLSKALFSLAAVLFSASAIAIPKDPCAPTDVCCEEPMPGPFAFSYPKDIGLACPRDFYVHGEFLLMKPSEEGLEYAIDQDYTTANTFPLLNGKVKGFSTNSDEWDWRYGFRAGFGFYNIHDAWNFSADWTYIKIKSDSEVSNGGTGFLLPLFYPPIADSANDGINLHNASSRWSGDYSTLDIMMGKPYHVSRYFVSNPMFGVRVGFIDQDYHVRYFQNDRFERNVWLKNDYWGAGLRGSYEGQFILGSGFSFYGKMAFALLFGKFDISQQSENPTTAVISPNELLYEYKIEDSFYSVQPNAELGLGVAWNRYFHQNQYQVSVKVGYEFHHWWDQNQVRRFFDVDPTANDTTSRGDLSFNGFMFGLHLEF